MRVPNVGDFVFEYNRKRFYTKGQNPGVGKYIGNIKDASSRNSECFVLFADKVAGEWVEIKNLRKAPSPGYGLFADDLQVQQRVKYVLADYPASGGVRLKYQVDAPAINAAKKAAGTVDAESVKKNAPSKKTAKKAAGTVDAESVKKNAPSKKTAKKAAPAEVIDVEDEDSSEKNAPSKKTAKKAAPAGVIDVEDEGSSDATYREDADGDSAQDENVENDDSAEPSAEPKRHKRIETYGIKPSNTLTLLKDNNPDDGDSAQDENDDSAQDDDGDSAQDENDDSAKPKRHKRYKTYGIKPSNTLTVLKDNNPDDGDSAQDENDDSAQDDDGDSAQDENDDSDDDSNTYNDPAAAWDKCSAPALPTHLKVQLSRTVSELVGPEQLSEMPRGYFSFVHRVAKHFRRVLKRSNDPLHVRRATMLKTAVFVTKRI